MRSSIDPTSTPAAVRALAAGGDPLAAGVANGAGHALRWPRPTNSRSGFSEASHWRTRHVWADPGGDLNQYPQFTTEIDGQRIQFLHVKSDQPDAEPVLITHGSPSSAAEFLHLIEPLVNLADGIQRRRAVPARLRLLKPR